MRCSQAQELMGAYLYGDLTPDEMRNLRLHTQECALCREDLTTRGRVVSSLSDATPELSDTDRQRIAWSVKGAVNRQRLENRPLILRLAPAMALAAAVLIAGFTLGRVTPHTTKQVANSRTPQKNQAISDAKVEITEKSPKSSDKTEEAVKKALELLNSVSSANAGAPMRETVTGSRGIQLRQHSVPPPDNTVKMAPDKGTAIPSLLQPNAASTTTTGLPKDSSTSPKKSETGADTNLNKLPKVTDSKNAETTPSESQ